MKKPITRMKSIITLICCLTQLSFTAFGGDYIWPTYTKKELPDSLKNEDAVYVENRTTYDFNDAGETHFVRFKRISINTKKGAEDFAQREIHLFNNGRLVMKKARIIKPTGEIIELTNQHIIETSKEEKSKYSTNKFRRIQFVFAGLDAGDVIDLAYEIDYDWYLRSRTLHLEDDLISLNSVLTLRNFSKYGLSMFPSKKLGNSVPDPRTGVYIYTWTKTGVKQEVDGSFKAPHPDGLYVAYQLWYMGKELNQRDLYEFDLENYSPLVGGTNQIDLAMKAGKIYKEEELKHEKLIKFIDFLATDKFKWISENEVSTNVKTLVYFDRNVINNTLFFRYMQVFCEEMKYNFDRGYTRSLLDGMFQHSYVVFDQLDTRFLLIKDEVSGGMHFVFGPNAQNSFYRLDEIPFYAEGNQSMQLVGDKINLSAAYELPLPVSTPKDNRHTNNILVRINSQNKDSIGVKRNDTFSGHYSYLLRGGNKMGWLSDFAVADTIIQPATINSTYPYETIFKQEKRIFNQSVFTEIDDTLSWFQPAEFIPSSVYFSEESIDELGDYIILPFLKYDKFAIYLESDKPMKLVDDIKSFSVENSIATLKMNALQVNPNQIKFTYELTLNKRTVLSESEKKDLNQLLTEWKTIQTKKWVIAN